MVLYDAFISYSHAKDKPIAAALQLVVQKLGKPWYQRRALRLFRDDTSLSATPHLWPTIETALAQSRFFILLASADACSSKWVDDEVAYWIKHKGRDTLLLAVTDGELIWEQGLRDFRRPVGAPLPPALEGAFSNEPKWVDLRPYRDGADKHDAKFVELAADFAATIHGVAKEDLLSQEVQQQRRTLLVAWSAAASLLLLLGVAGWQWYEANAQRRVAELNQKTALIERDKALLVESRLLTDKSRQQLREGNAVSAILLALEALPDPEPNSSMHGRPYFVDAQKALYEGMESRTERKVTRGRVGKFLAVRLDPGKECVYSQERNTVFSVCPGDTTIRADRSFGNAGDRVVAINDEAIRVVTLGSDNTIRLWNFDDARLIAEVSTATGDVENVRINKNGSLLLVQRKRKNPDRYFNDAIEVELIDFKERKKTSLPKDLVQYFEAMAFSEDADAYAILTSRSISLCEPPSKCDAISIDRTAIAYDHKYDRVHFSHATGSFAIFLKYAPSIDTQSRLEPGDHFISERGKPQIDNESYSILLLRKDRGAQFEVIRPERGAGRTDDITGLSLSRSGAEVYIAYASGRIVRLDPRERDDRRILRGHIGGISHLAFDPERFKFVTYGPDGTIRFWDNLPSFSWDNNLEALVRELNPNDDPDFHIRTDILAEILSDRKSQFNDKMKQLLASPDFERIAKTRNEVPRCLHPDERRLLGLDPEPPHWCIDLAKWPYDSPNWKAELAGASGRGR